jgi:hypothetical protein
MTITGDSLSADGIRAYIQARKDEEEAKLRAHEAEQRAEQERFYQLFMEREIGPDALDRVAAMVRKAVDMGERQVMLGKFPSAWLKDQGRAITNHAPDWPASLDGAALRAHAFFQRELEPKGFQMRAEIVDWPGGMPGDVGLFLTWQRPEEA